MCVCSGLAMERGCLRAHNEGLKKRVNHVRFVGVCDDVMPSTPPSRWERLCASVLCGPQSVVDRLLHRHRVMVVMAVVLFMVMMLPRADASDTDARLAGYESSVDLGWLAYSSDYCKGVVGAVGELLRLNIRRCWPAGATHLTREVADQFADCLGQNIGALEGPSYCVRDMYALMDDYVSAIGRCMSQCMAPPEACLARQFLLGVDPVGRCMGHGCIHECMSDVLP